MLDITLLTLLTLASSQCITIIILNVKATVSDKSLALATIVSANDL